MKRNKFVRVFCVLLLILQLFFIEGCTSVDFALSDALADSSPFSMHIIDVGQGDAVLLACEGSYMLIDAGEQNNNHVVTEYLERLGVKQLDYVVITHPHADHCGDMADVLTNFNTKQIIMPNVTHTTKTWENLVDLILEKEIPVTAAKAGDTYSFGSAHFTVVAPNKDTYDEINNYSVVLKAVYEDTSFLLTGDAEAISEQEILNKSADISATILKLGHHGSSTSTGDEFLKAVSPLCSVISCGKENKYGHPHKETLQNFAQKNIPVFRTDLLGAIVFSSNGKTIEVTSANQNKPEIFHAQADTPAKDSSLSSYTFACIGNKNSKIFHLESCSSIEKILEKNKVVLESREKAIEQGYFRLFQNSCFKV